MKRPCFVTTLLFLISSCLISYGQNSKFIKFDIKDFNQKAATSEWLLQYDAVAWLTSDSVMAHNSTELKRLGGEWFCFQSEDKKWHAVYGKYEKNHYDLVFHYLMDTSYRISRSFQPIDTLILNSYSRALITAKEQMQPIKDSINIRFNQYIKENPDQTFSVWIFPAFQPDKVAVYGGEFIYTVDKTGEKLIRDDSYFQGQFKGFQVGKPREIWLNYRELQKPTLGSVFFVLYYQKYFTSIKIDNRNFVSTTIKDDNGSYSWIHIEKAPKK